MSSTIPYFDRCNLFELKMSSTIAHDGMGHIAFCRIAESVELSGACNFIDFTSMPPESTIGEHTHSDTEEEFYLILKGKGLMRRDGDEFTVEPGDLIRNRPGGTHALKNVGQDELQLFVFEVQVR